MIANRVNGEIGHDIPDFLMNFLIKKKKKTSKLAMKVPISCKDSKNKNGKRFLWKKARNKKNSCKDFLDNFLSFAMHIQPFYFLDRIFSLFFNLDSYYYFSPFQSSIILILIGIILSTSLFDILYRFWNYVTKQWAPLYKKTES